jgi:hypothetical protein
MIPWHACQSEGERNVTQPVAASGKTSQSFRLSDETELTTDQLVFARGSWLGKALPDVIGDRVAPSRQQVSSLALRQAIPALERNGWRLTLGSSPA